tara:strand:+ start:1278 stop:1955 length:678 start_codon:yes stop_codon:yes gene_type:complete
MRNFKNAVKRLEDLYIRKEYYKDNPQRFRNYDAQIGLGLKHVEKQVWDLLPKIVGKDSVYVLFSLLKNLKEEGDVRSRLLVLSKMKKLDFKVKEVRGIKIPKFGVHPDISADLDELKKCYDAGCYRSCVVLCGRVLEVALHKKYYDVTGRDVLEKSPGIGLGKLVAKMCEKEIELDPGLTQQIHLINQVRVFSVHKKSRVFNPSKSQAHAMVLYTVDILEKLFKS